MDAEVSIEMAHFETPENPLKRVLWWWLSNKEIYCINVCNGDMTRQSASLGGAERSDIGVKK